MDTPEDQLRHLKMRVRNLERSLAESEALSLEQIECTHRLEQQLFEAQAQIESRQQALDSCRQQNQDLTQRPTQADLDRHIGHIQELQNLIWDLERRPTPEQVKILQQQVETGQAEIEMLKLELGRRVDPDRFYQLQRELTELKNYANQLGDYAARLPQIQLQHAQSQLQSHHMETELAELKETLKQMEQRPTLAEVETQIQTLQDRHQSHLKTAQTQIEQLQAQLSIAESEREALLQELSDQSYAGADDEQRMHTLRAEIEHLRAQVTEADQLRNELHQARQQLQDLEQRPSLDQVTEWEAQFQQLHHQIAAVREQRDHLRQELDQRPHPEQIEHLQAEIEQWRSQWQEAQAQHHQLQAELDQRPTPETMTQLQDQIEQMKTQWQAAQTQQQHLQEEIDQRPQPQELVQLQQQIEQLQDRLSSLEAENRELAKRPDPGQLQEAQRRQELAEAHHVVSKKQIDKLQRQIDELKSECVQAHAYAQTQEKEVALLEKQNQELQDQLIVLTQHQAARSQVHSQAQTPAPTPELTTARTQGSSPRSPITVIPGKSNSAPSTAQETAKPRPSNPDRIPTFSVTPEEEPDPTPDLLRRHSLYKLTSASKGQGNPGSGSATPPRPRSPRVDLPSFVRRSP